MTDRPQPPAPEPAALEPKRATQEWRTTWDLCLSILHHLLIYLVLLFAISAGGVALRGTEYVLGVAAVDSEVTSSWARWGLEVPMLVGVGTVGVIVWGRKVWQTWRPPTE